MSRLPPIQFEFVPQAHLAQGSLTSAGGVVDARRMFSEALAQAVARLQTGNTTAGPAMTHPSAGEFPAEPLDAAQTSNMTQLYLYDLSLLPSASDGNGQAVISGTGIDALATESQPFSTGGALIALDPISSLLTENLLRDAASERTHAGQQPLTLTLDAISTLVSNRSLSADDGWTNNSNDAPESFVRHYPLDAALDSILDLTRGGTLAEGPADGVANLFVLSIHESQSTIVPTATGENDLAVDEANVTPSPAIRSLLVLAEIGAPLPIASALAAPRSDVPAADVQRLPTSSGPAHVALPVIDTGSLQAEPAAAAAAPLLPHDVTETSARAEPIPVVATSLVTQPTEDSTVALPAVDTATIAENPDAVRAAAANVVAAVAQPTLVSLEPAPAHIVDGTAQSVPETGGSVALAQGPQPASSAVPPADATPANSTSLVPPTAATLVGQAAVSAVDAHEHFQGQQQSASPSIPQQKLSGEATVSPIRLDAATAPTSTEVPPVGHGEAAIAAELAAIRGVAGDTAGLRPVSDSSSNGDRNAAVLAHIDRVEFVTRVTEALQRAHAQIPKQLEVALHPPELGRIRISITSENGVLTARIEAQTPAARSALLENLPMLENSLARHGLQLQRVQVEVTHDQGSSSGDAPNGQQHSPGSHGQGEQRKSSQQSADEQQSPFEEATESSAPVTVGALLSSVSGMDRVL